MSPRATSNHHPRRSPRALTPFASRTLKSNLEFIGQQLFGNSNDGFRAALRFCRKRNLQVMECSL
jgi:hypothetical protein